MLLPLNDEEATLIAAALKTLTVPLAKEIVDKITDRLRPDFNADEPLIDAARSLYCTDDLEIDDHPETKQSEDGLWVAAWVYVRDDEIATEWDFDQMEENDEDEDD